MDVTKQICSIAKEYLVERKADEFMVALGSLSDLLCLNDDFSKERIPLVMNSLAAGIAANIKYDKESKVILGSLRNVLAKRTVGLLGLPSEVILHNYMMENLNVITKQVKQPNTSSTVRQAIISVVKKVLHAGEPSALAGDFTIPNGRKRSKVPQDALDYGARKRMKPSSKSDIAAVDLTQDSDPMIPVVTLKSPQKTREMDEVVILAVVGKDQTERYRDSKYDSQLGSKLIPYQDANYVKEYIFEHLMSIFMLVCDAVRSQASSEAKGKLRNGLYSNFDSAAFAEYFETLRLGLTGSEKQKRFVLFASNGFHHELISLLIHIDEEGRNDMRPAADITKGEIILLIKTLYEYYEEMGRELMQDFAPGSSETRYNKGEDLVRVDVSGGDYEGFEETHKGSFDRKKKIQQSEDGPDNVMKLLEMYVLSGRDYEVYNNKYMSHYYSLLLLLADCHQEFKKRFLGHNNWTWSISALVLGTFGSDSGPLHDTIYFGATFHAKGNHQFRKDLIDRILSPGADGGTRSLITQTRIETDSLRLLRIVFVCDKNWSEKDDYCIRNFVESRRGGLSQLSVAAMKFLKGLDDVQMNGHSKLLVEGMSLSLECLSLILDSFGMNQIRSLISEWPEVNEVNLLCTRLITRTDTEWRQCSEDSSMGKGEVGAVDAARHATELQKMLASVEAVAEAEAEADVEVE